MNGPDTAGPRVSLPSPAALLKAKTASTTNRTIATFLAILEELGTEHDCAIHRLHDALPADQKAYAELLSWFSEERYDILRTRVLRAANDARRELDETVDSLRL